LSTQTSSPSQMEASKRDALLRLLTERIQSRSNQLANELSQKADQWILRHRELVESEQRLENVFRHLSEEEV
jgi:hypothetical protein